MNKYNNCPKCHRQKDTRSKICWKCFLISYIKPFPKCKDCGVVLSDRRNIRCKTCSKIGKNSNNFKGGKCLKKYYCVDCKHEISISSALYGKHRCIICAHKGKNNSSFINGITLQEHKCIICNKPVNEYRYKTCSAECKEIYLKEYKIMAGKNNANWQGGIGKLPYSSEFTSELKEQIRKRDNYQCQNPDCNMTEEEHLIVIGRNLTVHHIDYNKQNCNLDNLISLCNQCNARANFNRKFWQEFFWRKIHCKIQ